MRYGHRIRRRALNVYRKAGITAAVAETGISDRTIYRWQRQAGLALRGGHGRVTRTDDRRLRDYDYAGIAARFEGGEHPAALADEIGVSRTMIYYLVNGRGIV